MQVLEIAREALIHESGHGVVGYHYQRDLVEIRVKPEGGLTVFRQAKARRSLFHNAQDKKDLAIGVAGHVAWDMHQELYRYGKWNTTNPENLDSEVVWREFRIGTWLRLLGVDACRKIPSTDIYDVLRIAEGICASKASKMLCDQRNAGLPLPTEMPWVFTDDGIIAEIVAAEKQAERILMRRWADVLAVADSLARRKNHRLTGPQLVRLLKAS